MAHQEGGPESGTPCGARIPEQILMGSTYQKIFLEDENWNLSSGRGGRSGGRAEHGGQRIKTWSFKSLKPSPHQGFIPFGSPGDKAPSLPTSALLFG